jgi:hypothetical protein
MKAGWNYLINSRKWHYFGKDGRSLCGKFLVFSNADAQTEDKLGSPDNCSGCKKKREKELVKVDPRGHYARNGGEMTEAEKYVRQHWPDVYIWGRMKNGRHDPSGNVVIIRSPLWSGIDGSGPTEIAAWADTANRLEKLLARRGTE